MALRELLLEGADERDLTRLAEYEASAATSRCGRRSAWNGRRSSTSCSPPTSAIRGGAGFPMGRKASFLPKPEESKPISTSSSTRTSPSPAPSRTERSCSAFHTSSSKASSSPRTRSARISRSSTCVASTTSARSSPQRSRRRARQGTSARACSGPTGTRRSSSIAARARASAARRPGSSSRSRDKRGQPRTKPPFPAISGLYASPTLINNVETLATVPKILEMGGEAYAQLGVEHSAGARFLALGQRRQRGELRARTQDAAPQLIYDFGGGIPDGRELRRSSRAARRSRS